MEKLDKLSGLPNDASAIQTDANKLFINANQQTLLFDINTLNIVSTQHRLEGWSKPSALPLELATQLQEREELPGISLETLILDLHSGRFFGKAGVLFVDFIGLLMCLLALTGLWAWYSHNKLRKSGG